MIDVEQVFYSYGPRPVLKGVTCHIEAGIKTGLIGPSASGKSTLMKILGGVLKQSSGAVRSGCGVGCEEVGLMFQEGALFDSLNVFDNVAFPLVQGRVPSMTLPRAERKTVHDAVEQILARVGLSAASQKVPGQLSGGMRRRLSLARALVARPKLLLLDDPTAGLDPIASKIIMNLIDELYHEYRPTTVLVSHDLRRLLPICDQVIGLFDGQVIFHGTRDQLVQGACSPTVAVPSILQRFIACRADYGATQSGERLQERTTP